MRVFVQKRLWKIVVLTSALAALAAVGMHPAFQRMRLSRAVFRAADHLAQSNYPAASISARQALFLNSNSIPACRVMAELAEKSGSARAIYWRQRLLELEPGNLSNHLALIQAAMLFDRDSLARETLAVVPDASRSTNALYHQIAAQFAFSQHDMAAAEKHLTAAGKLDPSNSAHTHNLGIVQLHSNDTNVVQEARAKLEISQNDPLYGTAILRALVTEAVSREELDGARRLSVRLLVRPDSVFDDRLVHLGILDALEKRDPQHSCSRKSGLGLPDAKDSSQSLAPMHSHSTRGIADGDDLASAGRTPEFRAFLAALEIDASENRDQAVRLVTWLAERGHAQTALDWIEHLPDALHHDISMRRAETECYITARRWSQLGVLLERSQWGADDHLRHAFLALSYRQQDQPDLARVEWKRALRTGLPSATAVLVQLAGAWHWEEEAEELLWETAQRGHDSQWALTLLARAYQLSGDTPALLRVFDAAAARQPNDLIARNNLAAASLLLKTNLASAHRLARAVYIAQPTNTAFACTYAYSLHLQGRTREGLRLLDRFPDEAVRSPGIAAYQGVMLNAEGEFAAAEKCFSLAKTGVLLPEESALVASRGEEKQ